VRDDVAMKRQADQLECHSCRCLVQIELVGRVDTRIKHICLILSLLFTSSTAICFSCYT
jgi:hypothetical protein